MKDWPTMAQIEMTPEQLERATNIAVAIDSIKADLKQFEIDGMRLENVGLVNGAYVGAGKLCAWHGALSRQFDRVFSNAGEVIFRKNRLRGGDGGR